MIQPTFHHTNTNRKITLYPKTELGTVLLQTVTQEVQVENSKSQKTQMDKIFASLNIPSYFTKSKQAQTQNPNVYASPYLTSCLLYLLVVVLCFPTPFTSPAFK